MGIAKSRWRDRAVRFSLAILFTLTALSTQADIYKWTDEGGQVHYGQNPPPHLRKEQIEQISVDTRVSPGNALPPEDKGSVRHCGSLALPANRLDPVTNIAMFREAIAIWQKYIDENQGKSDEASQQGIKDRRCAIAYANEQLQALSEVGQELETNYQRVSDELEELQQRVAECEELAGEEEELSVAACKQQHQSRIKQLETMLRRLEGPRKIVQPEE